VVEWQKHGELGIIAAMAGHFVRRLTDEELESPTRLRDDYYMR